MKFIQLSSQPNKENWSMRFVDETDYDQLFNEDVFVTRPDGTPLLVLLKNALSERAVGVAWSVLKGLKLKTDNRSTASGTPSVARKRKSGEVTNAMQVPAGWGVYSGVLGYFERTTRIPFCHACAWNLQNPEKFEKILPIVQETSRLFEKHLPDKFQAQKEIVDLTEQAYVIPGTVFTTLTVNKNFRTACHLDAGDLKDGFSCMSVIKEGAYEGGNLVLPNWRVAVKLENRDLILFDPHEFHGNTKITPLSKEYQRCSIVHYFREKMVHCKSPKEELEQVKNRKPGEHLF